MGKILKGPQAATPTVDDRPRTRWWVVSLVAFLGATAIILSFLAEVYRTKGYNYQMDVNQDLSCYYPDSNASAMAILAFFSLLAAQTLANYYAGCLCGGNRRRYKGLRKWIFTLVILICSWLSFTVASALLIAAAVENQYHTQETTGGVTALHCSVVDEGVFAAAAAFTLLTVLLIEIYYFLGVRAAMDLWREDGGYNKPRLDNEQLATGPSSSGPIPSAPEEVATAGDAIV